MGRAPKEEKLSMGKREMVLDIVYLMRNQSIQVLFQGVITKTEAKY